MILGAIICAAAVIAAWTLVRAGSDDDDFHGRD